MCLFFFNESTVAERAWTDSQQAVKQSNKGEEATLHLLTCCDFCDELCRIMTALHYVPCPQWEVSARLRPEQMGFDPLPCTSAGCKRQIHPRLWRAFSWARMDQPGIGFEYTLVVTAQTKLDAGSWMLVFCMTVEGHLVLVIMSIVN